MHYVNPPQARYSPDEIARKLSNLQPEIPWAHYYKLNGIETIREEDDPKFFGKSKSRAITGEVAVKLAQYNVAARSMQGIRVLDIASAEGVHSVRFALEGASEVVGVEGRQLYVERASFVGEAFGLDNVRFVQHDVRTLKKADFGEFDFINCCGILHHLGKEDFIPFLKSLGELCVDTLFIDAHVANDANTERFRLSEIEHINGKVCGALFREHADDASETQKAEKVRASIDNTFSFWPTEESLVNALIAAGFNYISRSMYPHAFRSFENVINRPFFIARK